MSSAWPREWISRICSIPIFRRGDQLPTSGAMIRDIHLRSRATRARREPMWGTLRSARRNRMLHCRDANQRRPSDSARFIGAAAFCLPCVFGGRRAFGKWWTVGCRVFAVVALLVSFLLAQRADHVHDSERTRTSRKSHVVGPAHSAAVLPRQTVVSGRRGSFTRRRGDRREQPESRNEPDSDDATAVR